MRGAGFDGCFCGYFSLLSAEREGIPIPEREGEAWDGRGNGREDKMGVGLFSFSSPLRVLCLFVCVMPNCAGVCGGYVVYPHSVTLGAWIRHGIVPVEDGLHIAAAYGATRRENQTFETCNFGFLSPSIYTRGHTSPSQSGQKKHLVQIERGVV